MNLNALHTGEIILGETRFYLYRDETFTKPRIGIRLTQLTPIKGIENHGGTLLGFLPEDQFNGMNEQALAEFLLEKSQEQRESEMKFRVHMSRTKEID